MQQAIMQQALEANLMNIATTIEDQLDDEMHRMENLTEDDLDRMRERRLEALKKQQRKRQEWMRRGHGEYREVDEKEFFNEMKKTERMVCHFFRNNWPCQVMDKHMAILAAKHVETKFVKVNAEKAPFLTERLKVWMLPTLALIKNEKTTDYVVGFDDLGGVDDFKTETLAMRLVAGGLIFEQDEYKPAGAGSAAPQRSIRSSSDIRNYKKTDSDEDSDFD
mmetsp:Transcript_4587/g.9959  ORF Transcript_4587/g.9959 Transcript_4587/m.9959 type:complete len:221 (-) Transcript_4587:119-781(-)